MNTSTDYSKQVDILHDIFYNHVGEERFDDFVDFNDIGLPLAYAIHEGIVESTPLAEDLVRQTFTLLLDLFGIDDDTGFDSLEQIMSA